MPIDIEALEEKRKRVLAAVEDTVAKNPHIDEYRKKLTELLDEEIKSHDSFINWITGLATGSLFLSFSSPSSAVDIVRILAAVSTGISFLCLLSAMVFKMLLDTRFAALMLEVSVLKNLYEGHDLQVQLDKMIRTGQAVTKAQQERFVHNFDESLDFIDPAKLGELTRPLNRRFKFLVYTYWQTIALFVAAIIFAVLRYAMSYYQQAG